MGFTLVGLDKHVSQNLSALTECNAADLSGEFEQRQYWVTNFVLNTMFRVPLKPSFMPFAFTVLRKAEMVLVEYEQGRTKLEDYLSGSKDRLSVYFRALYHFELSVSLLCQVYEFARKQLGTKLYENKDGSAMYRLNRIHNVSKHLESNSQPEGVLQPVWITNDGLAVHDDSGSHRLRSYAAPELRLG